MLKEAGMDEVYCMWYYCPKCGSDMIKRSFEYCPNCGVKLSETQSHTKDYSKCSLQLINYVLNAKSLEQDKIMDILKKHFA